MATPFDANDLIATFLNSVGLIANEVPDPFAHDITSRLDPALPVRIRGRFAQLAEKDLEITRVFAWQQGEVIQNFISSINTGLFSKLRELYQKEEADRSKSREQWFCGLAPKDQAMFDNHCLFVGGTVFHPLLPPDVPDYLRGPLARLAVEYAALFRRSDFRRNETEKALASRGRQNHTIVESVLNALARVHEEAKSGLVGRWLRELTLEQGAAFDGGRLDAKAGDEEADENSIRLVGDFWEIRFGSGRGQYKRKCIGWLRNILSHPHRTLTVPQVMGDPDGKLSGDAALTGETEMDQKTIQDVKLRLEEIDEIIKDTGGSETNLAEQADLLSKLQNSTKIIQSNLKKNHHNIASQIRKFVRDLDKSMPLLAHV